MRSNTQRRYVRIHANANDYPQAQLPEAALVDEELEDELDDEEDEEDEGLEDEPDVEVDEDPEEEPESLEAESDFLAGASLEDFLSEPERESVR